mmetsp:Transcript_50141/g.82581  ORF Transcript_50141/g.82581 Transcript_50141/m.82581 type:complete len:277 (+) Transcript_50141:55-885(+)
MAAFPFVHMCIMCLMAFVAAQRPFPSEAWSDSTGASFSEGNVITCTWGVLCRHGFSRSGPDEICESSFECTPAEVAVARPTLEPLPPVIPRPPMGTPAGPPFEPAQVPPVPMNGPGPLSPTMGNTSNVSGHPSHSVADAKPAKSPEASNASDASAPHEVPAAKPEANGTMPHMPSNSSELNNASGLIKSSGASNVAPRPSLRGSGGKGGVAEKPEEKPQGPRRLHSMSHGDKITCECGVVCQWGFRMEGAKKICNGPLYCSSCMPMQMGGAAVGGV